MPKFMSLPTRAARRTRRREFVKQHVDASLHAAFRAERGRKNRMQLRNAVQSIQGRSNLLHPSSYVGTAPRPHFDRIVSAVVAMTEDRSHWIRPVEEWPVTEGAPWSVVSSLVHHLFAEYPVPPVLISCWFAGEPWSNGRGRHWFRRVGMGSSLRAVGFPLELNKRMAHEFAHAPATMTIPFALRWAQVRGLGGSKELARAVAATRLGQTYVYEHPFWRSLLHLLINTPNPDLTQVNDVVEYLNDRRFVGRPAVVGAGVEIELDPIEPEMSLKGRTFASLVRRAAEWRAENRPSTPLAVSLAWPALGIRGYEETDDEGRRWTIRELLDSDALAAEGTAMDHCVATYVGVCSQRKSSIWSLAEETPDGRERLLTVEVDPKTRWVVQASRKSNDEPDDLCLRLLRAWAGRVGLDLKDIEPETEPEPAEEPALALV